MKQRLQQGNAHTQDTRPKAVLQKIIDDKYGDVIDSKEVRDRYVHYKGKKNAKLYHHIDNGPELEALEVLRNQLRGLLIPIHDDCDKEEFPWMEICHDVRATIASAKSSLSDPCYERVAEALRRAQERIRSQFGYEHKSQ